MMEFSLFANATEVAGRTLAASRTFTRVEASLYRFDGVTCVIRTSPIRYIVPNPATPLRASSRFAGRNPYEREAGYGDTGHKGPSRKFRGDVNPAANALCCGVQVQRVPARRAALKTQRNSFVERIMASLLKVEREPEGSERSCEV
jgi:hypothetical protein